MTAQAAKQILDNPNTTSEQKEAARKVIDKLEK